MDMRIVAPKIYAAMLGFSGSMSGSELSESLRELIEVRASQINGCPFCLDMHVRKARGLGISDDHLHQLNAWRDARCFSEEERAALELTEAVTRISEHGVSDELYERTRKHYTEAQYIGLLATINAINAWNRFMIGIDQAPMNP